VPRGGLTAPINEITRVRGYFHYFDVKTPELLSRLLMLFTARFFGIFIFISLPMTI